MDDEIKAHGWDAIDGALKPLYGDQEPKHFGTLISYDLGGPDPLRGVSAYRRLEPVPHWHFVTYGFSELYEKESDDPELSGYGFELTFRLAADPAQDEPPIWAINFLQNLARYVFQTGNVFRAGDYMNANGPLEAEGDTQLCSMAFVQDPELGLISTPNGQVAFLQVVGLTQDEELAAKRWSTRNVLEVFGAREPLLVTDLRRASFLSDPQVAARIEEGARRDGSSSGFGFVDALAFSRKRPLLGKETVTVTLGAQAVKEVTSILGGRLPFGKPYLLRSQQTFVRFAPGKAFAASEAEGGLEITLPDALAVELVGLLKPKAGRYVSKLESRLVLEVEPSHIRDSSGAVIEVIG